MNAASPSDKLAAGTAAALMVGVALVAFVERGGGVLAFDDRAAVGSDREADMRGARGDAAVEQASEREHLRPTIRAEAEIVDEQEEGAVLLSQFGD